MSISDSVTSRAAAGHDNSNYVKQSSKNSNFGVSRSTAITDRIVTRAVSAIAELLVIRR